MASRPWLMAVTALLVIGGVAGAGVYSYRVYDYVQHDNDFCMSCHLMEDPYELFAESAHRGLGCKACHQPNMIDRSQMALTQIIENPEEISIHAEVPNERCTECHVEGDPERWRTIATSSGHRVHLESADSTLQGLRCVECHSSSVHQFTPAEETCGQSSCHTDSGIQLGAMSDLTVHCVGCHSYSAPVDIGNRLGVQAALSPTRNECLACHEMRVLVELPEDDPHQGLCASCHNPHEQTTPAEAAGSCAIGGCHDDSETLTPFHQGLHTDALADCVSCHTAHDFSLDGENCLSCHEDIFDDPGRPFAPEPGRIGSASTPDAAAVGFVAFQGLGAPLTSYVSTHELTASRPGGSAVDSLFFRHGEHRDVDCASCHSAEERHGGLTVVTLNDCRSCHHTEPVVRDCAACHDAGSFVPGDTSRVHTLALTARSELSRRLPFSHDEHASEDCSACHSAAGGLVLAAASVSCSSCHEDHHTAESTCRACHAAAPLEQHPVDEVHVTCTGSGCHEASSFSPPGRTREFCLACHQDLVEHKIEDDRDCAACHTLPAPRDGGG
jgi:hypothetical protein